MDRVRFGRALGYGARHAAKSLAKAVDAATAPNPAATTARHGHGTATSSGTNPGSNFVAAQPAGADWIGNAPGRAADENSYESSCAASAGEQASHTQPMSAGGRLLQAQAGARQAKTHADHLRRSVWSPLARFSGVVWLQVTGTFFTLIALFLSQGLWRQREALRLPVSSPEAEKLYVHAAAFAIFAYFAVSSFVRAHLRHRR